MSSAPPDYDRLLDAEMRAFVRESAAFAAPPDADIAAWRAAYDAMSRAFHQGRPAGVAVRDTALSGVSVRIYSPEAPRALLVYCHGGGFVLGGLDSHDDVCAEIAAACALRVVAVDYRLAPEHPHPAAYRDTLAATRGAAARFGGAPIVAGDSAGATLVAAACRALRGTPAAPAAQVLIYPYLGGDPNAGSYLTHAEAPMLGRAEMLRFAALRGTPEPHGRADPTAAPLAAPDLAGVAPAAIVAAACDPLAYDARAYHDRLRAAGVAATLRVEPGLVHGFLRARHRSGRARAAFARITGAITAAAAGPAPSDAAMSQRRTTL